jgi:signal transduction histidine kinase
MADNNNAIHYYLQAASIFEGSKLYRNLVITYNNIGGLFTNINDDEKAFDYYTKALGIARTQPMEETLATVLLDAGIGAMRLKKYTEAELYLAEGITLSQKNGWNQLKIRGEITMSELLLAQKQYQKAIEYGERGLSGARQLGSKYFEIEALGVLALAYNTLKNAQNAIRYAELGVTIGKQNGIRHNFVKFYSVLSNAHAELGDFKDSYKYLLLSKRLEDSINQKEVTKKIEQLEISYQSAQKQKQILQLQRDQKSQQIFIGGLIFGIVILLLVGFSIYRNFLNRRKISEQKQELIENEYKQLKQKHQLVAAASILQGEEEERKRLAKDLHDGLGGLLTGVKISLSNIKGNMLLQQEDVFIFERALDMLDNSITELRRVAHNMMPEALVKFGLATAIKDFCESINSMKALSIAFQVVGQPRRFASSQEIIIYRIVQELVNNTLKHSNAEKALVQLSFELNEFSLTVEDNGRGFDKALIESSNTNGWKNIKSRVEYLKGSLDVSTTLEEGTSVHIRLIL